MSRYVPHVLIILEISAIALIVILICALFALAFPRLAVSPTKNPVAAQIPPATVQIPLTTPTTPPTSIAKPTLPSISTSSLTPTTAPSPTSDPRVMVNSCMSIESPGMYVLDADISANSPNDCIRIATSQVTLDCAGHSIRGLAYNGAGVSVRKYGLLASQSPFNVEVENCNISRFHFGVMVESGSRISIHDNVSSENYDDVDRGSRFGIFLGMTEGGGIRVNNATDSTIWNNTTMSQAIGIDIRFSNNVVVRDNTSSYNSAWGINVVRTNNSQITGNTTADNIRQCTWGAGVIGFGCDTGGIILQDGSNGNMVSVNRVVGRNGNGIFIKAHAVPCGNNNSIVDNIVEGALYNSIELSFCTGNKINDNTFRDGLDGIWLGFAHDNEIKDNTIVNMKNHGIISSNSHNNTVSGNHITNANVGIYFYSEPYDRDFFYFLAKDGDYTSHHNCLCDNVFQSNTISIHLNDSAFNYVTNNDFRGNGRGLLLQGNTKGTETQGNRN